MNDTAISLRLGAWWEANARDLPWRFGRATPWGVLVSEVMSQQTQMSRVVPYWTDWMERWPDARALAEAPKAEVITAWGRASVPSSRSSTEGIGKIPMTFIRAPYIESVEPGVQILAKVDGNIVGVQYQNQIAISFHPELDENRAIHKKFLAMCEKMAKVA